MMSDMSEDMTQSRRTDGSQRRGTVFLVDDNPGVRTALARVFQSVGYEVHRFDSAKAYLEEVSPEDSGCLVLDIKMPGMTGLDLQERLSTLGFTTPIIFITGYGNIPASVRAMKWGAVDFLEKPLDHRKLLDAVERAVQQDADDRERQSDRAEARLTFDVLTPREFEVMTCMVGGMPNREIARELEISEKTVKIHRGRVMKKMEARSLADLMRTARDAGIEHRRTDAPPTSA